MPDTEFTLIHLLGKDAPVNGTIKTRGTVRMGKLTIGDSFWLAGADRKDGALTVVSVEQTPRWSKIMFSGRAEDVGRIAAGTYLYGRTSPDSNGA